MIGNPLAVILLTSIGLGMMIYDGMSREIYDFDIGLLSLFGVSCLGLAWIISNDDNF